MYLLIDIGNTKAKWALADDGKTIVENGTLQAGGINMVLADLDVKVSDAVICSTGGATGKMQRELKRRGIAVHTVNIHSSLPITIDYETPETLGADRIATACGAWRRCHQACVIVDAGTCVTVDYVDSHGFFRGGAILPGVAMQLTAMHRDTARLPLLTHDNDEPCHTLGRSTYDAMMAGVIWGLRFAMQGFVKSYTEQLHGMPYSLLVTGGDGEEFCRFMPEATYSPLLAFEGMLTLC